MAPVWLGTRYVLPWKRFPFVVQWARVAHDNARDDGGDRRRPSKADSVLVTWLFVVFEPVREASKKMWNAHPTRRRGHGHGIDSTRTWPEWHG